ncbi:hypothetical protein Taro_004879 [Colocasia esculenta]|uniref:Retrotransposon gag domain-containing protein n=1 Tax=Colocasia esculenta TaxID=4460 RepID=A0A843TSZ6_COLES|nr:hypothetical protein [Colocasia esculenta]
MTPPFFKWESDPIMAESWLRETKKIFCAIRCVEEERVTLATYMLCIYLLLQERADVWWSSILRTQFKDGTVEVAWTEFVHLFRAKYIPEHVQDRMAQEFLTLTQGSISVLEYEARFKELSKYAPHIVADERRKVKKFIMGLKPSLRTRLVAFGHRSMQEALSAACMQDAEMEVYLEEKRASLKRPRSAFQRQDKKKKTPVFQPRAVVPARVAAPTTSGGTVAEKPLCSQCGKRHTGEGQTFFAKGVSTHLLLVSTQCFKAKAECCRNGEVVSTLDHVDTLWKLCDLKSLLDTWHSRDLVDRPWIMCPRPPRVLLDTLDYKYSPNWPSNHKRASKSLPEIFSAAERALLPVPAPLVLLHPNSYISKHKKRSLIQDEAV